MVVECHGNNILNAGMLRNVSHEYVHSPVGEGRLVMLVNHSPIGEGRLVVGNAKQ